MKLTLSLLFLLPLTGVALEPQTPDTIKVINNARVVTVTRNDNKTILKAIIPDTGDGTSGNLYTYEISVDENVINENIEPDDILLKLPFAANKGNRNSKRHHRTKSSLAILKYMYWGWNFNYDGNTGLNNCFELGIADLIGVDWETSSKTTLGIGVGFGYNRVTSSKHALFAKDGDALTLVTAPDDRDVKFARWDTWRFQVPLMYSQKLASNFGFGLAAIINFNTYSTATNRYISNDTRYTETLKRINMRLLTVDFMFTIGIVNNIGVYAKWSPVTAMQPAYGPSFRNFSTGININF
ncbi:MAG: hypothetical protein NC082_06620 [Clostridiales bacterium]|nr:hypothetical protein [Clostridiales bacterium]